MTMDDNPDFSGFPEQPETPTWTVSIGDVVMLKSDLDAWERCHVTPTSMTVSKAVKDDEGIVRLTVHWRANGVIYTDTFDARVLQPV